MDVFVREIWLLLIALLTVTRPSGALHQFKSDAGAHCWIDGGDVQCDSQYSTTFDLAAELDNINTQCNEMSQSCHFTNLFVQQSLISALNSTDFGQLSFDSVHVYSADELKSIDIECGGSDGEAAGAYHLSKQLFLNGPSKLTSNSVDKLLSQCTGLVQMEIALQEAILHRISPCRVRRQPKSQLKYLVYRPNGYEIGAIEDYAFDCLPRLEVIKLTNVPIRHIAPNAFSVSSTGSNHSLVINLENCQLTDSIWQTVALSDLSRPAVLMLDDNWLTHLPQTMQPFLDSRQNVVSLYDNPIDCSNLKPHVWLLQSKDKYRDRVWGAKCTSGHNLFEMQLYEGKCAFRANESTLECVNIGASDFNIRQEVIFLQQIMNIQLERLHTLTVTNCTVTQIAANVLNSVPVSTVKLVNLAGLTLIDSEAFTGKSLQTLTITGANQLQMTNILSLVRTQATLQQLSVSLASGARHSLPKNAFIALNHVLQSIEFTPNNYRFISIGGNFIAKLPTLTYLSLRGITINEIETDAFATNDGEVLTLNLSGCNLDETKLGNRPFDRANRPLKLDLSHNSLRILTESSFDFLLANSGHLVDLADNPITCQFGNFSSPSEHPYHWLYLNRFKLRVQMVNAKCDNSSDLFEYLHSLFDGSPNSASPLATMMVWSLLTICIIFYYFTANCRAIH